MFFELTDDKFEFLDADAEVIFEECDEWLIDIPFAEGGLAVPSVCANCTNGFVAAIDPSDRLALARNNIDFGSDVRLAKYVVHEFPHA